MSVYCRGYPSPSGLASCWACLIVAAAGAAGATTRPATGTPAAGGPSDVRVRDVRFQRLPDSVREVYVGPDQRTWFVVNDGPAPADAAALRAAVEAEFGKAAPRLAGIAPVLFE